MFPARIMPSLPSAASFPYPASRQHADGRLILQLDMAVSPPFAVYRPPRGRGRIGLCFNVNLGRYASALNSRAAAFATHGHRAADRDEAVRPTPSWGLSQMLNDEQAAESPMMLDRRHSFYSCFFPVSRGSDRVPACQAHHLRWPCFAGLHRVVLETRSPLPHHPTLVGVEGGNGGKGRGLDRPILLWSIRF